MERKLVNQLVFLLILFAIWQVVVRLRIWPDYVFPSPMKVANALVDGFRDSTFIVAIGISLRRLCIGFAISIFFGVALGLSMGKFKFLDDVAGGVVLGLQTLPSICWLPLAVLWFGLNERAILFVVVMGALFSITIATESGMKNIPQLYIKAGRNMGATGLGLLREVMLPAALPQFVSGLKQGWSFAWRSLMAGELLFVSMGLGHLLAMGRELNDMSQVMAVMIVIASISVVVDKVFFGRIEREINRCWGLAERR